MNGPYHAVARQLVHEDLERIRLAVNPDPLYVDDEPWPLYPDPAVESTAPAVSEFYRRSPWVLLALAVVALIAARRKSR